jgi:hypothetical protein
VTLALFSVKSPSGNDPQTIRRMRSLEDAEEVALRNATEHLRRFWRSRDMIHLVDANLGEVRSEVANHADVYSSERRGVFYDGTQEHRSLQGAVVNYLTAVRLYLDHRQTQLTRDYGPTSSVLAVFNESRRRIHQGTPEYRFTYELRNYVQHCGMPLQSIQASQEASNEPESQKFTARTFVGCSRDSLLRSFGGWKHSADFLRGQKAEFEILPILETMRNCLWSLETEIVKDLMPSIWSDARTVVSILGEASTSDSIGMIASLRPSALASIGYSLSFYSAPFPLLDWLGLIHLTAGPPGYSVDFQRLERDSPPDVTYE